MWRSRLSLLSTLAMAALSFGCSGEESPPAVDAGPSPTDGGEVVTDAGVSLDPIGLHYHRADGQYDGWVLSITGAGITEESVTSTEQDAFGAFFPLPEGAGAVTFSLQKMGQTDSAGTLSADLSGAEGLWVFSGHEQAYLQAPGGLPAEDQVVVYYLRDDATYDGWGLHLWEDVATETLWSFPKPNDGVDERFGAYFVVDVAPEGDRVNVIVHMGDEKDPGPDMGFNISEKGNIVFLVTQDTEIYDAPQEIPGFAIDGAAAHWIDADTFAWNYPDEATQFELHYSPTADIEVVDVDVQGGASITLSTDAGGLSEAQKQRFVHLRNYKALKVDAANQGLVEDILKGQIILVARDASGVALQATRAQLPGVLDDLYSYQGPLGASFDMSRAPTIRLWAPTAQDVKLVRLDAAQTEVETLPMARSAQGVWSITGDSAWYGTYYQYEVTVYHPVTGAVQTTRATDPWALSLSENSESVQLIDVANDTDWMPAGWDMVQKPALEAPEDIVLYETHIRDFSMFDTSVAAEHRGKYLAYTYTGMAGAPSSDGMDHLKALQSAGLTHVHLLPAFDIATINEDPAMQVQLTDGFDQLCAINSEVPAEMCTQYGSMSVAEVLGSLDPKTGDVQQVNGYLRSYDGFNWGYDPYHYTVPEGSYATDASGPARVLEFRAMVQGLADAGLRTVLDVVYNHTNASGLSQTSVLDKVVPGYYHRLNTASGFVENSTCCQNTATEHTMMERLMIDSLVAWAKYYKVDAFRFDLMGHHMKVNMERARDALQALTLANDGVDGSKIYLYGEGWDFGEVVNGTRGVNATQANMDGTGIGTFNDRVRDGVRGGGPFDAEEALRSNQGFINGVVYDPNDIAISGDEAQAELLNSADLIRLGMAGNLAAFRMVDGTGAVNPGRFINYNGARAGYTADPQETVNYVSKHDNQTLWDMNAYKMPTGTDTAQRVRAHNVGLAIVALGQGVPFFHMGSELLRSKSMQRDSYDSGDWYNRVDFTKQDNNWNVGLPRQDKDGDNWRVILGLLDDATLVAQPTHIEAAADHFEQMLRIRKSSRLFRLRTAAEVMARVDFHNVGPSQIPGLVAMSITDGTCAGADLDPSRDSIFVLVNANDEAQTFAVPGASGFALHTVQQGASDPVLQGATFDAQNSVFAVPGRTVAVFSQAQSGAQGVGLPCNIH